MQSDLPLNVTLTGASGRMGRMLTELMLEGSAFRLVGAVVGPNDLDLGKPVSPSSPILFTEDLSACAHQSDVLIDFSLPEATPFVLQAAQTAGKPLVCGVTGLGAETLTQMKQASHIIPVFYATNMSLGIAVMTQAVVQVAKALESADIEILELHHAQKKDSPSGTALSLGEAAAEARGWYPEETFCFGRHDVSAPRPDHQIGFASLRGGSACGTHTVFFLGQDETLSITHESTSRRIFALGALRAARWLALQKPGLYGMKDLL